MRKQFTAMPSPWSWRARSTVSRSRRDLGDAVGHEARDRAASAATDDTLRMRPPPAGPQVGHRRPGRDERGLEVDGHHEVVAGQRDVEVADEGDGGVVHEDVEPTELGRPCARPWPRPRPASARLVGTATRSAARLLDAGDRVVERAGRALRGGAPSTGPRQATFAPASASATAMAAPTPRDAPVTRATLPSRPVTRSRQGRGQGGDAGERAQDVVQVGAGATCRVKLRRARACRRLGHGLARRCGRRCRARPGTPAREHAATAVRAEDQREVGVDGGGQRVLVEHVLEAVVAHVAVAEVDVERRAGRRRRGRGAAGDGSSAAPSRARSCQASGSSGDREVGGRRAERDREDAGALEDVEHRAAPRPPGAQVGHAARPPPAAGSSRLPARG